MNTIGYWLTETPDSTEQAQLLYIMAHPSEEAGKQYWKAFGNDPK